MKVVVIASLAYSLVNFRKALLRRIVDEGHQVVTCAPDDDAEVIEELEKIGVTYRRVQMDRTGMNPWRDLRTLLDLRQLIREEAPSAVLAYTQKPIIYGGIAARLSRARFFAMVSGLGHLYCEGGAARRRLLRTLVSCLYRFAVAKAVRIFVFNGEDEAEMRRHGIVRRQAVVQVPGSGIDLTQFQAQPTPEGPMTFLMIARLMRDKGLAEFVAAARMVRRRLPDARFQILGPMDPNPTGISRADLDRWTAAGDIEYLGETRDVRPFLAAASAFVLPTYYREGLPRTILEAMATGRAIITTDTPGCRETVEKGANGLLVPPRDAKALADAMIRLARNPQLIRKMGQRSREIAENRFDVVIVNKLLLSEMALNKEQSAPDSFAVPGRSLGDFPWLEISLATSCAIVLLPVIATVALVVLVSLGRPILFVQTRVGRDGKLFPLVKFRSMAPLNNADGSPLSDDLRLTAIGRFLRRTRLDELPEFWNVLCRDMSLIGPRPLLPETIAAMGEVGRLRSSIRPGLTGWAQVNGNVLLSDADKLSLDRWYVTNRSLAVDALIAAKTVMVVVRGERLNHSQIKRAHASTTDRSSGRHTSSPACNRQDTRMGA